ncbi:NADP-dependent aldehyde dehydrogenase [Paraburkholderia silvatlantica]|uniref:NADP-dependent aldehyde dehydrogenase n=1 Tax=Paraburkholderia silvatlantica TaxID=321895 RepID=A0A2V4T8W9_9BURK|nr:aldehyde dehydrogenase (NADP(+)) [Paraburkholderia silvatlantica]PYE18394.1 NADP-dependent aldehyde dehydrogenase [Paraburkholderia silvatlantica]
MRLTGHMLIGAADVFGQGAELRAFNPATDETIDPPFGGGGAHDVDRAARLAAEAFDSYSRTDPETRARFIERIATNLEAGAPAIVERCMLETGLPRPRLEGEVSWTVGQLRLFADVVRRGQWRAATLVSADPDRAGGPRPDMRMHKVALGPVGVFGASNFPILYSVAGGDTASALAAGAPVVCRAHPSHPGTSELVGRAIRDAVAASGLHEGVFSLLTGAGHELGEALVDHPEIKAIAFTGSEAGGMAIYRRGQQRTEPIPVFAEMASVNPHFLLPAAQATRATAFAARFVEQMVAGVGQMCLKPGIVLAVAGAGFDVLRATLIDKLSAAAAQTMLSPGIHGNYERGVGRTREAGGVTEIGHGLARQRRFDGEALLFEADARSVIADMRVAEEVFGPMALLIRCASFDEMHEVARHLRGQLSIVVHLDEADHDLARTLMPVFERKTGRIVANSFSNVVEICDAQIHGGPFPATTDPRFTSVGSSAIERFLRPVAYQGIPADLLPPALQDGNPLGLWRVRDRQLVQA